MATPLDIIDETQDNATPTPVSTFEGVAIPTDSATTIQYENGITIKTQEFGQDAPEVIDQTSNDTVGIAANFDGAAEGGNTVGMIQPPPVDHGPSRDDEGNLMPGWEEGEFGDQYVGGDYVSIATQNSANESRAVAAEVKRRAPLPNPAKDWRVRISLAKTANYLYRAGNAGILSPLKSTDGVIFPYMPTIQVGYSAKYDSQLPTHSNFMIHNYQGSSVEGLTITGDFTAQSVPEANYLLAVIHFFKSATKMFYGEKDANRGVPPPLLYLSGLGQYQFDNHPMVLTNFNYSLPVDVDYIDAYSLDSGSTPSTAVNGVSLVPFVQPQRNIRPTNIFDGISRLLSGSTKIQAGGTQPQNSFKKSPDSVKSITRVPSKISISLSLHPMITRKAIVNSFNLQDYATGKLLKGSEHSGGGIW